MRTPPATEPAERPPAPAIPARPASHRGRASPLAGIGLARAGLRTGWRTLLAIAVGMLVAVMLVAAVPIFASLAANIQLQATINREGATTRNIQVQAVSTIQAGDFLVPNQPGATSPDFLNQEDLTVRSTADTYLSPFVQHSVNNYLVADPAGIAQLGARTLNPQAVANPETQFEAFDYAQAGSHMRLVAGRLPQPTTSGPPEAIITQQMAQNESAKIGDLLATEPAPSYRGGVSFSVTTRIVGIWVPQNVNDDYWSGRSFISVPACDFCPFIYPTLLDHQAFVNALTNIPGLGITQYWIVFSVPARITTASLPDTIARIKQFRTQVSTNLLNMQSRSLTLTDLDRALGDVQAQLSSLGLPLYIVVAQVVGLALLFVATMADLLAQVRAAELATLRSRGASSAQLLLSYAVQGLALAVPIALAGPWLASLFALRLVGLFVPPAILAAAHVSPAFLSQQAKPSAAVVPALLGALLGLAAILAGAWRAGARNLLALRREEGRIQRPPLWRRLYVDVWLAILCLAGYIQLSYFGGTGPRAQTSQGAGTLLLAAAPGLLLLAGALLLLRIFPWMMAQGARLVARGRGAPGTLALAQLTRTSAGPGRLTLLVALAVGLGLFALTYAASLVRSAADQASYQAGAEIRLVEQNPVPAPGDAHIQAALANLPGVAGVTPAYRIQTNVVESTQSGLSSGALIALLGVDPTSWARVAAPTSWRGDYASASPAALMAQLLAHQWGVADADRSAQTGAGSAAHPVWAIVSTTFAQGQGLRLGNRFYLSLPGAYSGEAAFTVGAIVPDFPTLYPANPSGGFVVADLNDCLGASTVYTPGEPSVVGPNEFWLQATTDPTRRDALLRTLTQQQGALIIRQIVDRAVLQATIAGNPLQVTIAGLLLAGAGVAALLALLGSVIQATSAARLRQSQFAVLRTLGMGRAQLARMLLGELLAVYGYGLVGGTLLGALLATATLPYLQFSTVAVESGTQGVPAAVVTLNPIWVALFYAALLAALALALALTARYAALVRLEQGLRRAED